jgi:hypothetical protein
VTVLEELGGDAQVFFLVDAPPGGVGLAGSGEGELLADGGTLFTARIDPRTQTGVGHRLCLAVDPAGFHFFDPESGKTLLPSAATEPRLEPVAT